MEIKNSSINTSAAEYFDSGWYCAESVLLSLSKKLGIESDLIPKLATPFCSGLSRTNGICGAVAGAIIAIGLKYGRKTSSDNIELSYSNTQIFIDKFLELHGSINCNNLTKCDFTSEAGHIKFNLENKIEDCKKYVKDAEELAVSILKL